MVRAQAACGAEILDFEVTLCCCLVGCGEDVAITLARDCSVALEQNGELIILGCYVTSHDLHQLPSGAHERFFEFAALAAVTTANHKKGCKE